MGWLPDPTGRFDERYRTRTGWTQRVRVGAAEAVDEVAAEVAATDTTPDEPPQQPEGSPGARWRAAGGEGSGWRPDPTGRFEDRWWDGTHFTRRVRHGGSVATDTLSPPQSGRRRRRAGAAEGGAGWRPDPDGSGERYHDGHDWTAKRRPAGTHRTADRPGSLRAWLPRSVAVVLGVATVLTLLLVIALVVWLSW